MTKPTLYMLSSEEEFYKNALEDVLFVIQEVLEDQDQCHIGLAGGSTPKKLYELMAEADLPWNKLNFTLIDERYVPSDDPESNLKMLRKSLFSKIPLAPDQVLSFDTSLPSQQAIMAVERRLKALQKVRSPLFDLLILGAGADGHVASLFSDEDLDLSLVRESVAPGYKSSRRLSLGMGALTQAKQALLLLKGASKQPLVDALQREEGASPIFHLAQRVPMKVLAFTEGLS